MYWLHANVQVVLRVYVVNFVETKALGGSKIMGTAKLHTVHVPWGPSDGPIHS